jgi:hypothetical protein
MIGQISVNHSSSRNQIIDILGNGFPLTAKKLYNKAKKLYRCEIGYVTFYKHIKKLMKDGVLEENNLEYNLSSKWIQNNCNKFRLLESNKFLETINKIMISKRTDHSEMLTFSSHKEFSKFTRLHLTHFLSNLNKDGKNTVCWVTDHTIVGLLGIEKSSATAKLMKEKGVEYYSVIDGKTPLDEFTKTMYKIIGYKNVKIGVSNKFGMNIGIYNDIAICIIRSSHIKEQINATYNKTLGSEKIYSKIPEAIAELTKFINSSNTPIQVIITKNPVLVRSYKKYIMSFFDNADN